MYSILTFFLTWPIEFFNRLGIVRFMLAENGQLYGFDKKDAAIVTRVESRYQLSEALLEFEFSEWHALLYYIYIYNILLQYFEEKKYQGHKRTVN